MADWLLMESKMSRGANNYPVVVKKKNKQTNKLISHKSVTTCSLHDSKIINTFHLQKNLFLPKQHPTRTLKHNDEHANTRLHLNVPTSLFPTGLHEGQCYDTRVDSNLTLILTQTSMYTCRYMKTVEQRHREQRASPPTP